MGLTASGVTRALLPLEKMGLVERAASQRDARVSYAALSKAGAELLANASATVEQASNEFFSSGKD